MKKIIPLLLILVTLLAKADYRTQKASYSGEGIPNPAKEFIVISCSPDSYQDEKEKINLTITDVQGKKVFETQLQTKTLHFKFQTSNFSNGIYFVELNNGREKTVKKFLKE